MPAFALIAGAHPETNKKAALLFGMFPKMTAKQTLEIYRPLAHAMEQHLRRRVAIHGARDFNALSNCIGSYASPCRWKR